MISRGGHFEGALHGVLAADLFEVHFVGAVGIEKCFAIQTERRNHQGAFQKVPCFFEAADGKYLDALDHGGFGGIFLRHKQTGAAALFGLQGDG